jgi:hypothetical protein
MQAGNLKPRLSTLAIVVLSIALGALTAVALKEEWRQSLRSFFIKPYRQVLGKTEGQLSPQGPRIAVIKVKTDQGIHLEVYKIVNTEELEQISELKLDEKRDGFVSIKGEAANLALVDFDSDSTLEIVAPTYDENLVARLNVFKYDQGTLEFRRALPSEIQSK